MFLVKLNPFPLILLCAVSLERGVGNIVSLDSSWSESYFFWGWVCVCVGDGSSGEMYIFKSLRIFP